MDITMEAEILVEMAGLDAEYEALCADVLVLA
jgi:hypothetical protein